MEPTYKDNDVVLPPATDNKLNHYQKSKPLLYIFKGRLLPKIKTSFIYIQRKTFVLSYQWVQEAIASVFM